jgi:hypothetical protein
MIWFIAYMNFSNGSITTFMQLIIYILSWIFINIAKNILISYNCARFWRLPSQYIILFRAEDLLNQRYLLLEFLKFPEEVEMSNNNN